MLIRKMTDAQLITDAEPVRHGMFIGTEFDGYADGNPVYYEWKCSECGCIFEEEEPTYRYCPQCGARMDANEYDTYQDEMSGTEAQAMMEGYENPFY